MQLQTMTKRALLIGINYFGSASELSGCINDIKNMKVVLTEMGYTEFIVLHDGNEEEYPEFGSVKKPTRVNIMAALQDIVAKSSDGDYIYWHYSGHGTQLRDVSGGGTKTDEKDGMDEAICPVDYVDSGNSAEDSGFIRDDWLRATLCGHGKKIKVRAFMDCCHSGSICDLPYMYNYYNRCYTESKPLSGDFITISGCKDNQTSADSQDDAGLPSGAMTWALLKSLKEIRKATASAASASATSAASTRTPMVYSWKELLEIMRYKLRRGGYTQIPQLSVCAKSDVLKGIDL